MANKVNFYKSDKPEELRDFYKVLGDYSNRNG